MKRVLVTPPVYYPLVLQQLKDQDNIDYGNDDSYIQGLIAAATEDAEQVTRRRLITQTWKFFLNRWPPGDILIPYGQLQSVTHIKYKDTDGDQTTFYDTDNTDDILIDTDSELGRAVLAYGSTYPTTTLYPVNPIEIQFVCGYGSHAVQVITGATNASPIVITIVGHGFTTGDTVFNWDVAGQTAANGNWIITKLTADTFSLNGSITAAAYTSGGSCIKQAVNPLILHAIKLKAADLHENREDIVIGQTSITLRVSRDMLWMKKLHEKPSG